MARRAVQYYRAEPPPESEWERDFATMARSGFEGVVLPAPWEGLRNQAALSRQAALAARCGLRVLVTPTFRARAARPDAAELRSWAKDVAEVSDSLTVLLVARVGEAPPCDAGNMEWGFEANGFLPHRVADQAVAFARHRPFWVVGLPAHTAEQVRLQAWSSLAVPGASLVYEAWRPDLQAGLGIRPGLARPDGAPSPRLEELLSFGRLLARHPDLATAKPFPAEAAVVVVRESERFWAASDEGAGSYWEAMSGAYEALGSRGAQVEFAPPDGLAPYPVAYLPMSLSVSPTTADALRAYVEAGGCLVAEAGVARFDERGATTRETPRHGLVALFGARALDAAETVSGDSIPTFSGRRGPYPCFGCREPLEATGGRAKSAFADGTAAIVDHALGSGTTRLIGTWPALGFARTGDRSYAQVILDSLALARLKQRVITTAPGPLVRLIAGASGLGFLCALNPKAAASEARLRVSRALGRFRHARDLQTGRRLRLLNNRLRMRVAPYDGVLLRLEAATPRRWQAVAGA
ncbi:MAG TPA: beta-galactosidase trimerization domain-containing protein [Planctomycetota bacterium]|nr:beta-galactosidase trimerization domain-containing protein [Planctomycetota bacterium]HRR80143.1 beta-galactosidase trimerization domain-containing protein [Planctomycetota bacterium]HRT96180.1 beta-galactosidase trimerization domain-containing protein [Planctomycetota bacterium]